MTNQTTNCLHCDQPFSSTYATAKYCCRQCKEKAKHKRRYKPKAREYVPKACVRCSTEFTPTSSSSKYCDPCRAEVQREHTREWQRNNPDKLRENARRWRAENPEKVREWSREWWRKNRPKKALSPQPCVYCGVEYMPTHPHSTLCSTECKTARGLETSTQWREANPERAREYHREVVKPKAEERLTEVLKQFSLCVTHDEGVALALQLLNPTDTAGHVILRYQELDQLLAFYLDD